MLVAGTLLATANYGGSTWTDGSAMPTRTELGASVATYGMLFGHVTTALNGGAGTCTITYTDQDGNTGNTQNLDMPGSAVLNTAFLQYSWNSGDYGIRDITNISYSGQSSPAGVAELWGITPIVAMFTGPNEGQMGIADLIGGEFAFQKFPAGTEFFTIGFAAHKLDHGLNLTTFLFMLFL
jgi:uncharacterized protein YceK